MEDLNEDLGPVCGKEGDGRRDLGTQELFRDKGLLMIEDSSSD